MPVPLTKESEVDVLVIGAGPAGLMGVHALKRAGVNVRVVDQRPQRVNAGQADGIQPRTTEVLQSYGLAERLLREGNQMHMAAFYNPGPDGGIECTGRAPDISAPTARYPHEISLHQGGIEDIFLDSMRSMGLEVERPVVPSSIEWSNDEAELKDPHSHPVKVVLKYLDVPEGKIDTEIVRAKFVVGTDGAHSWVRKACGIVMEGEQTEYIWGVVDMPYETDFPDIRNRCAVHSSNGSCMLIPRERDVLRLYVQLTDTDVVDANGRVDKSKVGPQRLIEVANKSLYPYTVTQKGDIEWWTLYIIGQRVASKFSINERIFIAGDACHTHSPKGGQGMNASMNDTHNLAWKLAHVLRGWADISLLKTYEAERRKYAQELIDFDKKFSALFSGKPRTEENQDGISHEQFLKAFQAFGMFTSGIGVHYQPSAIVNAEYQSSVRNLIIGQRVLPQVFVRAADTRPYEIQDLLPADARFKIIIFAGAVVDPAQSARVHKLAEEMGRPDGFLTRFSKGRVEEMFDVFTIASGDKFKVMTAAVPALFRSHWSKLLTDDQDMFKRSGGGGYEYYGVDPQGAIVVVRPDGYVGTIAPFERHQVIDEYFASFMLA